MFEHPSHIYNVIVVEQERVDRANELRRVIAENPSRVVARPRAAFNWMRGWFGSRRADAAAPAASSGSPRANCDGPAQPAHAR